MAYTAHFPISSFLDVDGKPLENGYVYIGTAGLNPVANPITVYWDAAATQVAAQPIRTIGGYPSNNGVRSRLYVNAVDYSIKVTNVNGTDTVPVALYNAEDAYAADIIFLQAGSGAVARTVESKLRESISVLDFGADSTGLNSSIVAFTNAVANGGTVFVPKGTYKLDSRLVIGTDGTTLLLDADVTLLLSGVAATQSPFGNQIHVFADNCAVIGSGPSSVLQITGGSRANAVGILHHKNFTVRDLKIDGDKAGGSAIADDTFMSGISIVSTTAGGAGGDVQVTVDNCIVQNFLQYGINVYGDLANGVKIVNCNILDIGKAGDALSVGAGIVVTRACSDLTVSNNVIKNCKQSGMLFSSAGEDASYWTITGNSCHQNGKSGIEFNEEAAFGSIAGQGIYNVAVTGNTCNGNTRSGIQLNVNTVGYLKYFCISGNVCQGNTLNGIEALTTNTAPNSIAYIQISGNQVSDNVGAGFNLNQYVQFVEGVKQVFTPNVIGSVTPGAATWGAGSPAGVYEKIGNIVYYQILAEWTNHTGAGDLVVSGFPYASSNVEPQPSGWVWANGLTITGQGSLGVTSNQTQGTLLSVNNGSVSPVALDTAATLRINGFYFT